jgi:pheromone shutdown protein TraB
VDPESGAHGVTFGTTMSRAVEMAREANLRLELVDG